jgi:ubiquinone/menaquinone biosynthesis C-methylase UbiE
MDDDILANKRYYETRYRQTAVDNIVEKVQNLDHFLHDATRSIVRWRGLYYGDFRHRVMNATILELGAGTGLNSLVMAALGAARVVAVDISQETTNLIHTAAERLGMSSKVDALTGDFEQLHFEPQSFDFVVGMAFLHHLTHDREDRYLSKVSRILQPMGEARFVEPASNSALLESIRLGFPVRGRPSKLNTRAFELWQQEDPHPTRDNSSMHYQTVCQRYFKEIEILPLGALERLQRFLPWGSGFVNFHFRHLAFQLERLIPFCLHMKVARSQIILLRGPCPLTVGSVYEDP